VEEIENRSIGHAYLSLLGVQVPPRPLPERESLRLQRLVSLRLTGTYDPRLFRYSSLVAYSDDPEVSIGEPTTLAEVAELGTRVRSMSARRFIVLMEETGNRYL
jgi:hypothetical protein